MGREFNIGLMVLNTQVSGTMGYSVGMEYKQKIIANSDTKDTGLMESNMEMVSKYLMTEHNMKVVG